MDPRGLAITVRVKSHVNVFEYQTKTRCSLKDTTVETLSDPEPYLHTTPGGGGTGVGGNRCRPPPPLVWYAGYTVLDQTEILLGYIGLWVRN